MRWYLQIDQAIRRSSASLRKNLLAGVWYDTLYIDPLYF